MRHPMEMAAEKGPVEAVGAVLVVVDGAGASEVSKLTRLAEDAPRRDGALTEDCV